MSFSRVTKISKLDNGPDLGKWDTLFSDMYLTQEMVFEESKIVNGYVQISQ